MSIEPGKVGPPGRDWHPLKKLQAANHYHFSCSIDELSMMPDQLRGQLFLGKKTKRESQPVLAMPVVTYHHQEMTEEVLDFQ